MIKVTGKKWERKHLVSICCNCLCSFLYKYRPCIAVGSDWNDFVNNITTRWKKTVVKWLTSGHSVLVVCYEDLLTDVLSPVERMLDFLKFPYNHTELIVRLADGFEDFRRNHTPHSSQIHYSPSQTMNINSMITETIQELKQHNLGSFGMEEYII